MTHNPMPKVLLIEPPSSNPYGTLRILGSLGSHKADMAWAPLDLMIIAGLLDKHKIPSVIIDANTLKYSFSRLKEFIRKEAPAAVVFTTTIPTMDNDCLTAKMAKEVNPAILTVAIGLSIESSKINLLQTYPYLDTVIYSEPELPLLEIIRLGLQLPGIKGLYYRENGRIIKSLPYPQCRNLDEFGIPAHEKVPYWLYRDPLMKRRPMTLVSCSRGCMNACNHCLSIFQRPLRYRSVGNVLEELRKIKNLGIREIKFFDCGLTNDLKWTEAFLEEMIAGRFNFSWNCNARADRLPPQTLALMKKAGCHTICIGSESANQEILDTMGKNLTVKAIKETVREIQSQKMQVLLYFTFGLIGETRKTMRQSIEFAKEMNPDLVTFGIVVPVWGTRFYDYLEKNKLLDTYDLSLYDPNNPPVYSYPELSSREIHEISLQGYREFYLRPRFILKRFLASPLKIGSHWHNLRVFVRRYIISSH
jgi:radical SAM superfamily enzyme YgiQ (UPF0313 family)